MTQTNSTESPTELTRRADRHARESSETASLCSTSGVSPGAGPQHPAPEPAASAPRRRRKPERKPGDDWTIQELARKHRLCESKVIDLYTGNGLMNIAAPGKRRCLRVPDSAVIAMESRLRVFDSEATGHNAFQPNGLATRPPVVRLSSYLR